MPITQHPSPITHQSPIDRYVTLGHVSEKTDSFAFGIVLTEVITGMLPHKSRELQLNSAPTCHANMVSHPGTTVSDQSIVDEW